MLMLSACEPQKSTDIEKTETTPYGLDIKIPQLLSPPQTDGDLSEWKHLAFTDGVWDLDRVRQSPWYNPTRNRLADHGEEGDYENDLQARYYMAWDADYLYLGADVLDNKNDVSESKHTPKRWYYKDAIAWFIEAPRDELPDTFDNGNHGFAFVIDTTMPDYGAWWRHGDSVQSFIETPIPDTAVDYEIRMKGEGGSYVLEARIRMDDTFGKSDPAWQSAAIGDVYSLMIVHCDPDGGEYGGHLLIYGKGDPDESWSRMELSGPIEAITRKPK